MRTMLFLAFIGNTRAHNFTQSINIVAFQAQPLFYFLTHTLRPWLGSKGSYTEADIFLGKPHTFHHFC